MASHALIVEDNSDVLKSLEAALRSEGFSVHGASSFAAANRIVDAGKLPDDVLLIVDVALDQGESGVDLAVSIAKRMPSIRILFISGFIDELLMVHAGVPKERVGFLGKPFEQSELMAAIKKLGG